MTPGTVDLPEKRVTRARLTQLALFVNLLGAVLILIAFQPASSPRSIVTDPKTGARIAECDGDRRLYLGGELSPDLPKNPDGTLKCPDGVREPIVTAEFDKPWLFRLGVSLMIAGGAWQIWLLRETRRPGAT